MRKVLLIIGLLSFCLTLFAQSYNEYTSMSRVALVYYYMDEKGFYQKKENVNLQEVTSVESTYNYDKKSHELYVQTANANCIVTVIDNLHKILKKSKSIPQLKSQELAAKVNEVNMKLEEKFYRLNMARQQHINDSIQKARMDSIMKAREDSIRLVKLAKQKNDYRKSHDWRWVPVNKTRLTCTLCDKIVSDKDSLLCVGYRNDTLYHLSMEDLALEETLLTIHKSYVPNSLRSNERFKYHVDVFRDSLLYSNPTSMSDPETMNSIWTYKALQNVEAKAPNGYFNDWGWDSEYGSVSFHFRYTNTNKKTIKYIEVFWVITNGVGDVRRSGSFRGTGPLEFLESASWNWDYSSYYVAGDASEMNITKVIITYMNGTKVTIPKNKIQYD